MTEQNIQGPRMLCATDAVKSPPLKIGKISDDIVFPRAIPIITLVVVGVCAVFGAVIGLAVGGLQGFIIGAAMSGFFGYIIANYSPLRGESFLKWVTLTGQTKHKQLEIDGQPVILHIGIARVRDPAAGAISMRAGAIDINPIHYDERGVLRKESLRDVPAFVPPTPAQPDPEAKGKKSRKADKPVKTKTARARKMPD